MTTPKKREKLFFWLILGSFSVFFAEVISGSDMFPYFNAWGIVAVMPLYTLHILVLSYIVFNLGRPRLSTLFIAGAIFGMYEAYITKVLWSPTWGPPAFSAGGTAVIESIILVLWWHPFMAFIVPLFTAENMLTGSKEIINGLPERVQKLLNWKYVMPLFALLCGIFQSSNSRSAGYSILSGISTIVFLTLLIYFWGRTAARREYVIRQLLPSKNEFKILLLLLALLYVSMGAVLRPEALPVFSSQAIIWLIYGFLFILLYLNLRKSGTTQILQTQELHFSRNAVIILPMIFIMTSAVFTAAGIGMYMLLLFWFGGGLFGIFMLINSIKDTIS